MRGLEGRTAVVVGAAQGIGRAVCAELARYKVKVAALDARLPEETKLELAALGADVWADVVDVRSLKSMQDAAAKIAEWSEPVSLVVNTVNVRSFGPLLEISTPYWNNTLDVILTGGFNTARAFCPGMIKQSYGSVVFFSSVTAHFSFPNLGHYQTAKMGLEGLARALAFELGPKGIRVNCVAPWLVATPNFGDRAEFFKSETEHSVLKKLATPEDIARTVTFLLSDESSSITGRSIDCDGGYTLFAQDFDGWLERRGGGTRPGEDGTAPELPPHYAKPEHL